MKRTRRRIIEYSVRHPDLQLQPALLPLIRDVPAADLTIQERFELFHATNPEIYHILRRMALDLAEKGHQRIGVKMLWETLRYCYYVEAVNPASADEYRLNNIYTSRYARLLAQEPTLAGRLELRELKAA